LEGAGGGGSRVVAETFIAEEIRAAQASVAFAALRVEDPERCPPPRRAEPVAGDGHVRLLADDIATEPDPRPAGKLQAQTGRFGDGRREAGSQAGRFEDDEEGLRAPGQGREPAETVRDVSGGRAGIRTRWQIDDEQIHRPTGNERAGDREALIERVRGQDDEPVQPNPAGDGLDRVEAPGKIQPGHDRAIDLGLRGEPEGEGRLAGARLAAERHACAARQAARAEDRVEGGKAGPNDPLVGVVRSGRLLLRFQGLRGPGQRPDRPRSCGTPACLEGRQGSRHVRGKRRHDRHYRTDVLVFQCPPAAAARHADGRSADERLIHSATGRRRVPDRSRGDVAQLGEHRVRIAGVRGSSPLISTIFPVSLVSPVGSCSRSDGMVPACTASSPM
jgi:hypothetical protein